jgi:hypothetical protein
VVVDRRPVAHHPAVDAPDPVRRDDLDRDIGVGRVRGRGRQLAPGRQRRGEAGAAQAAPEPRELARAPALQQRAQRLELGGPVGRERRDELVPAEQVDVEVADRAGERLHPLELVAHMRALLFLVHGVELAQHRAGAPHRHTEVVEELRVEVGDRAGHVGLGDPRQHAQHRGGGLVGAGARGQRDARLRRDAARATADGRDRLVEHVALRWLEPEPVAQHVQRARVLAVVAEHGLDGQPRGERRAPGVRHRLGALDHQPHHRLRIAVEHRQRQHARAQPHHRHERAHLEHVGEPPPHRPRRQLAGEVAGCRLDLGVPGRRARLVEGQDAAAAPGRAFGAQARRAQPAVEGVEQDAVLGARAADFELEPLGEQRNRARVVEGRWQQQVGRGRQHAA